jgi:hypothetical protein
MKLIEKSDKFRMERVSSLAGAVNARQKARLRCGVVCLIVYVLLIFIALSSSLDGNETSRLASIESLVIQGDLDISEFQILVQGVIRVGEKLYSDKAPGVTYACVPSAWAFRSLWAEGTQFERWHKLKFICVATVIAPFSLFGLISLYWFCRRFAGSAISLAIAAGATIGLPVGPHCAAVMPHAISFALITKGLALTHRPVFQTYHAIVVGGLSGLAISCEYTAGLAAMSTLVFVIGKKAGCVFAWMLGLAIGAVPIGVNHMQTYGTLLALPYSHSTFYAEMNYGLSGLTFVPDISALWALLFDFRQGLFTASPGYLLAWLAFARARRWKRRVLYVCALFVTQALLISSCAHPLGGQWRGCRFMICICPYLILEFIRCTSEVRFCALKCIAIILNFGSAIVPIALGALLHGNAQVPSDHPPIPELWSVVVFVLLALYLCFEIKQSRTKKAVGVPQHD